LKAGFIGVPEYLSGKISRDIGIKHEDADAMSKKLILGIALSLVIISGSYFRAQANCCGGCLSSLAPCNWHFCGWHLPSGRSFHCGSKDSYRPPVKDMDKADATRQGGYSQSSTTP